MIFWFILLIGIRSSFLSCIYLYACIFIVWVPTIGLNSVGAFFPRLNLLTAIYPTHFSIYLEEKDMII